MSDKALLQAAMRADLTFFLRKVFETLEPGHAFMDNWHVHAMTYQLMQLVQGKITRLVITMPPRHMKSMTTSIALPAWILGHDPTARIICVSYSQELAEQFSTKTRLIMEADWYRSLFPNAVLGTLKNTKSEFWTTQQGSMLATSVGGQLTGHGCDYLIVDDPHKADDATSEARRKQAIEWFQGTATTRLNNPTTGRIITVQQRIHEADLAGTLLASGGWTHLNLQAIADQTEQITIGVGKVHTRHAGEALHPARMNLALLKQVAYDMGSMVFAAQYQQRPAPAGGGIVKLEWLRRYPAPFESDPDDYIVQSWDIATTAAQSSNFSVCLTWACRGNQLYLIGIVRQKMEFPMLRKFIPAYAHKWNAGNVIVEATGVGLSLFQELQRMDCEKYVASKPKDAKDDRLMKVAHMVEAGKVWVPESAPWLAAFLQELESFPNGKYDDQVDAFSQSLKWLYRWTQQSKLGIVYC